jgi:SAM-dependent methyltransferase
LILYKASGQEAAQHFVLKEVNESRHLALQAQIEKLWTRPEASVMRCVHCGFVYAWPFVAGDMRFYELAFIRTTYPSWKWEFGITRERLRGLCGVQHAKPLKVLEIGAGDGRFLAGISPLLVSRDNIVCTEYSDYGRETLCKRGFKCLSVDIRKLPDLAFAGTFDVICLFQVFEHLDSPYEVLHILTSIAAPGAHLFMAVPNPCWTELSELSGSLLDMPPNHLGRYGPEHISLLGQRTGWKMIEHEVEPSPWWKKCRSYLKFHYLRVAQDPSSVANQVQKFKNPNVRRLFQLVLVVCSIFTSSKILWQLLDRKFGIALWVHLEKQQSCSD